MPIDMYYSEGSSPCEVVMLVAAALNVSLNLIEVDLQKKENIPPDFVKLNPQRSLPTIVDDGFALWESRAIARYLANKYGTGGDLYPADPRARAVVDQRLDFDLTTLYPRFAQYFYPQLFANAPPDSGMKKKLDEGLGTLNCFLEDQEYCAGPCLTIADLSLVSTVATIDAAGISLEEFPNVQRWFELVKSTAPAYKEVSAKGAKAFKELVKKVKSGKPPRC